MAHMKHKLSIRWNQNNVLINEIRCLKQRKRHCIGVQIQVGCMHTQIEEMDFPVPKCSSESCNLIDKLQHHGFAPDIQHLLAGPTNSGMQSIQASERHSTPPKSYHDDSLRQTRIERSADALIMKPRCSVQLCQVTACH